MKLAAISKINKEHHMIIEDEDIGIIEVSILLEGQWGADKSTCSLWLEAY